ncbi:hypothetical protein M501DRAFT_1013833 [Patellaria atrata CBS 101060]|uniref:BTB domain-containing protein n=1 Tax=Patellaria atrata CBS 101060 TaxID=1346257 RepID=A0A9P4SJ26_9PEZI|nr:hypothetical protein M501DRAFT_1013833 [Patellaria atrata CBS 101060]
MSYPYKSQVIHLRIGPNAIPFQVQLGTLRAQSGYFNELIRIKPEDFNNILHLDFLDPEEFSQFATWLSTHTCPGISFYASFIEIGRVWLIGERMEAPSLQNQAMESWVRKYMRDWPPACIAQETTLYLYSLTEPGSPLRSLIADCQAHSLLRQAPERGYLERYTPEEVLDICLAMSRIATFGNFMHEYGSRHLQLEFENNMHRYRVGFGNGS